MFIDRESELSALESHYRSGKAEMIILYGRRRVGKTELIRKFIGRKPHIYYMADRRTEKDQLELYSTLIGEFFTDEIVAAHPLTNWELVFKYLSDRLKNRKPTVLVFDEFPYLVESTPAIPSIFQRYWDQHFKRLNHTWILCGSSMSFMEKELLGYKSPLYGRRTSQLEVLPFEFKEVTSYFPSLTPERLIEVYSVFGGIPAYLDFYEPQKSLWNNIQDHILQRESFLHNEVQFLLMEELRTPQNYFAILRAIALGNTKINEIVQSTGLERGIVGKYLDHLMELRIVERKVPVTESYAKSRKGIYKIKDNYVRFWFKYVFPNRTYIEEGRSDFVLEKIRRDFATFVGMTFETVAKEYLKTQSVFRDFFPTRIGSWWDKYNEIDIVAIDETNNRIVIGECKWSNKKIGVNVYEDLKRKQTHLSPYADEFQYILFAKRGFTKNMQRLAKKENVALITVKNMV